jgi:endo-1,4-beta-xylanase
MAVASAAPFGAMAEEGVPSLCQVASQTGLLFGCDSDSVIVDEPPKYAQLIKRHCNLFASNLSWQYTQPRFEGPDPGWEDPNVRFARQNNIRLTGGHLIWHERVPDWFRALHSRDASEHAIVQHITALGRAYSGAVFSWNVVNEAIEPYAGRIDGMRRTLFLDMFGEAYFEIAFNAARAADPSALLVYNDYDLEMAGAYRDQRRRALIMLLDRLLARRVPIDAIGLQSHLNLTDPFNADTFRLFLKEIADRGVRILITEFDVLDDGRGREIATRDAAIADLYARVLTVALDQKAVVSVVTWGLSDRYTWLSPTATPRLRLPPGPPRRPLPFDADFRPKPAYYSLLATLRAAPMRSPPASHLLSPPNGSHQ